MSENAVSRLKIQEYNSCTCMKFPSLFLTFHIDVEY